MKFLITISLILFFVNGCTNAPVVQSQEEINAQKMIKSNISEAEKARNEYLALQAKRKKESSL